jgi:hypothetical protein
MAGDTAMSNIINASTSAGLIHTADTSGTIELQSNGTTKFTVSSTGAYGQVVSGTAVASTSGTSIDFTSIPSWVKRITVMLGSVSTSGTSAVQIQIGSGSVANTGYISTGFTGSTGASPTGTTGTAGFLLNDNSVAARSITGTAVISLLNSTTNLWVCSWSGIQDSFAVFELGSGNKALSGALDRVRITTVNGTDTFDAGSINILYEG